MMDRIKKTPDSTLQYYEENAESFIAGTIEADMNDARQRFLKELPPKAYILDFGCGSGRDTKAFLDAGYIVDAVDGSPELCRIASVYTGIQVKEMLFQNLHAEKDFDGIWACASILHLPKPELSETIKKIVSALKAGGVLYTSFKYGTFEGMRNGRYFTDFTEDTLKVFWSDFPSLPIITTWLTQDVRTGREEEQWINLLARRV